MIVRFLRSRWSRPLIPWYARRHNVKLDRLQLRNYRTFRDFFARKCSYNCIDYVPEHLISPCDDWLTAYSIEEDSSFFIKGMQYRLEDLLDDSLLAKHYEGGTCMVFRLCASDYHRYCYIDDGYLWQNHYIPGVLHSVQPIACETYPVYMLNRRCWCLMVTRSFGPVVQTEIGALAVGGIVNHQENTRVLRGDEKGWQRFSPLPSVYCLWLLKTEVKLDVLNKISVLFAQSLYVPACLHHVYDRENQDTPPCIY